MTEKPDNIKDETENERKGFQVLTDEQAEQITGGYWEECETSGCGFYGHSQQCRDQRQRGKCPYGFTY